MMDNTGTTLPAGWENGRSVNDALYDIELRLQAIEKQLARLIPLIEVAERYLAMTPMQRVRASLHT